jgi:hypothetical protein
MTPDEFENLNNIIIKKSVIFVRISNDLKNTSITFGLTREMRESMGNEGIIIRINKSTNGIYIKEEQDTYSSYDNYFDCFIYHFSDLELLKTEKEKLPPKLFNYKDLLAKEFFGDDKLK